MLIAYHNDPAQKDAILAQLAAHRAADQLIKGQYWENGKGCAVACTIHSGNHQEYETRFGIPQILARLEDRIFEGLPNGSAMEWPQQFMGAIRPGADLTMVWPRFALWLLTEEIPQFSKRPKTAAALDEVGALYREWCESGKNPDPIRWQKARKNAYAYAASAAYAYAYASAAYAYASAASAAYASASAAYAYASASAASAYAASADDADDAARDKAYQRQAAKLLELLAAA